MSLIPLFGIFKFAIPILLSLSGILLVYKTILNFMPLSIFFIYGDVYFMYDSRQIQGFSWYNGGGQK